MPSIPQLLFKAEDLLGDGLTAMHYRYATLVGKFWLKNKQQLHGCQCHCPTGITQHLLHSEGLREVADVVVDFGSNVYSSARRQVPVNLLRSVANQIGDGDIVHVKADLMDTFIEHVFDGISGPIVLITGDSDFAPVAKFKHLLEDPRVLHWFAQNCDIPVRHPKLTRIPIGIDNPIYNKLEKRIGFFIEMVLGRSPLDLTISKNEIGNQELLQEIAEYTRRSISTKPLRALCTFHMNQKLFPNFKSIPERWLAYSTLKDNPNCFFIDRRISARKNWRMHADFSFEVSPRGKGLDCFRTWESLFLQTIPIVKTSTLDPLYLDEDFPVVILESFDEITAPKLLQWREDLGSKFTSEMLHKLTVDYWVERVRNAQRTYKQNKFQR